MNCMVSCLFARNVYTYENIILALKSIGIERTEEELKELGRDIFRKKYELKKKFGFKFENLTLPKRFLKLPRPPGCSRKKELEEQLSCIERKEECEAL
ncbi:MAG: hypothetical protein NHB15_11135 [Methanosarcina barkeri]|nr:hypothetical protein [Methanosarcina sp. ERenArc_MAG2]